MPLKSYLVFVILFLTTSAGWASKNLNPLMCAYMKDESGWHLFTSGAFNSKFELGDQESVLLSKFWTSGRPALNYSVCNVLVGTKDDDAVTVIGKRSQGTVIDSVGDDCAGIGNDIETEKEVQSLRKGSFVDLESEWLLAPAPDRILLRTYLPTDAEADVIGENSEQKCIDLAP